MLKIRFMLIAGLLSFSCSDSSPTNSSTRSDSGTDSGFDAVPLNLAPVARDDEAGDVALIDVLANDTDDRGIDPTSLRLRSQPEKGAASVVDGKIEFRPDDKGRFSFRYDVADEEGLRSNQAVVVVDIPNFAPQFITSPVLRGTHDSEYRYEVSVSDFDANDILDIRAPKLPAWLILEQIDETTVIISGVPNAENVGTPQEVVLSVSDSVTTVEQQFSITVVPSEGDLKLESLSLNREAITLSEIERTRFPEAEFGFRWNEGDDRTDKWRPQGIAEIETPNKTFVAVSWYGRDDYEARGARISFADVSDRDDVRYRHAILVDANEDALAGVHAGGIVHKNGNLYVPDSRAAHRIHVFPIASLTQVSEQDLPAFYNYGYYLKTDESFTTEVKPSFMSFDWSRNEFLFGSFTFAGDGPGTLEWTSDKETTSAQFYEIMQGAASDNNRLWIATSCGRNNNSKLYYGDYVVGEVPDLSAFGSHVHPPGLEDLDVSRTTNRLWLLTEFGPHEGPSTNHRTVFYVDRDRYFR